MYGAIRICIELLEERLSYWESDEAIGRFVSLFLTLHFVIRLSVIELLGHLVLSIGVLMELLERWVDKLPDG